MFLRGCITSGRGKELQIEAEVDTTNLVNHNSTAGLSRALIQALVVTDSHPIWHRQRRHHDVFYTVLPIVFHQHDHYVDILRNPLAAQLVVMQINCVPISLFLYASEIYIFCFYVVNWLSFGWNENSLILVYYLSWGYVCLLCLLPDARGRVERGWH